MDAEDDGPRKKRKAAVAPAQRKKPRRTGRGKSEFVSVEVGMREFKKRLAATGTDDVAACANGVEDLTQDVKATKTRVRPTKVAAARKTAIPRTTARKTAPEKKQTTPVKKTATAARKTAVAKKATTGKNAAPVKRTTRAAVSSKMTLAEVKLQLEREQKERVEYRIQTLHREPKPSTVCTSSTGTVSSAPVSIAAVATAPAVVGSAPVAASGIASTPVPAGTSPFAAHVNSAVPEVVTTAQKHIFSGNSVVGEKNVLNQIQSAPSESHRLNPSVSMSNALSAMNQSPGAAAAPPVQPLSTPVENQFIVDDMEEDLMFALALEEVEQKLATPQKSHPSSEGMTSTDTDLLVSANFQAPVAPPAKPVPEVLQPEQDPNTNQGQLTAVTDETKQEAPVIAVAPGVLEEMERLRRENELLRRSNELLQAAVTSPAQKEDPGREHTHSLENSRAINAWNDPDPSPKQTSSSTTAANSTARYLDLARCDSDHDMKQKRSPLEDDQPHPTDVHHSEYQDVCSEAQGDGRQQDTASIQDKNYCENQNKPEDEVKPVAEQETATDHAPNTPKTAPSKEQASAMALPGPSTPSSQEDHPSTQPIAIEFEPDQEHETATRKTHPTECFSLNKEVNEQSGVCATTAGSADGDVSDVSMSGDDEDEEEVVKNEDGPYQRTSTIDSGNYTKYKVRQEDDFEVANGDYMDEVRDNERLDPTSSIPVNQKPYETMVINEPETTQKPGTPANSEIIERTTVPSNIEDEEEEEEEEEEEDDEVMAVQRVKRREVIALSSSSSESESESGEDEVGYTSSNVLEAALKAAGGDSGHSNRTNPPSVVKGVVKGDERVSRVQEPKLVSSVPVSRLSLSDPVKPISKKRKSPGLSSSAKRPPSVKSSLLWPALDEFYDFLLDLSPRNVRASEQKRVHIQKHAGEKLPTKHPSIEDYCNVQLDAIMEELVASVSNTTDRRGGGGSGPTRQLSLTSVSPCGMQGPTSSGGLSCGAIFSESGFTGSTSNSNDYILTFDASVLGKKGSSDFLSGDLVLLRSPRWKNYEMSVFGVVLCDSVVAVGGKVGKDKRGGSDSDQICVLIRARSRDQDDPSENFSVLTELCLSNQRALNWRWSMQQVHNTTTSAREFQAIKAISFFPNDLKQVLLRGQLISSKTEQTSKTPVASSSVFSPRLLKYLQKHYNESQVQAILGCLGEDSRVIIQGPPGTGKTKTILGLLSALLDGAGLSMLQKAKGTARIRVGASLQSARTSAISKTVAETSIRILVAAPSNAAVDELVVRVLSEGLFDGEKGESYRPRIVRVGRPESSQQLSSMAAAREASESKKNRKKMRKYAREVEEVLLESLVTKHRSTFPTVKQARQAIIKNAQIVFCTLSGAGSVAMCEFAQDFDALIIDEAAQAVEASTLIPFKFRPHRVVLVGDHRQLPATVISKKLVSMGYDRSLQQRLVENDSPVLLLTQQYRMHPEIAEFPSAHFYGGRLVQDDNMREWTAQDYHRDRAFKPLLFLDVQGSQSQVSGSTSLRNMSEVEAVVQLVRRLLKKYPHIEWKKRIGVIAPYKQQIYEVRGAIGKLETEFDRRVGIEVNTVDGFQGREKEIIIYSCVRTSHGGRRKKKRRSNGNNDEEGDVLDAFWADERRMNVAITRAKSSLWIVGNSTLLTQSRAWRALIQHAKDHNRYIGDSASTLFATNSSTHKASKASSKTKQ